VEEQARRAGEAIALVAAGEQLSYGDLDSKANIAAHNLRQHGVGPEVVVGICGLPPLDRVTSVLAVLKAGGAFLPLDPEQPDERLRFMLADAAASLLVTTSQLRERMRRICEVDVTETNLIFDPDGSTAATPASLVRPQNLAYVIYTSGTTGVPKAIAVEHQSVSRYLMTALSTYAHIDRESVILQLAPFTFDPWLRDAIGPLTRGAKVILLPSRDQRNPERIIEVLKSFGATHILSIVPSMLKAIVTSPSFTSDVFSLTATLVSGESFSLVRAHDTRLGPFGRVINHYGPTECTLIATVHEQGTPGRPYVDLIGSPIPGVAVHILDGALRPVPVGAPGEIHIGGRNLSRGYWRHPRLTAEAFVPDPFGDPGSRLYRTGDIGRWLEHGEIEFLGRSDHQIKLRGQRIEPAEVEAALTEHQAVEQAAVVLSHRNGNPVLAAYFTAPEHVDGEPAGGELRRLLEQRIPQFMIPSFFISLAAFPRGPNGKIDREALRNTEIAAPSPRQSQTCPRTQTQDLIARIWAEALGMPNVGIDDNFFELGGHSLIATQIASRMAQRFGAEVTVETLFESPTVAKLAATLDSSSRKTVEPIRRRPAGCPIPLSISQEHLLIQQRAYALDWRDIGSGPYVIPVAYRLAGPFSEDAFRRALAQLIARHESLRTVISGGQAAPEQVVLPRIAVPLSARSLTRLAAEDRERAAAEDIAAEIQRPFDLTSGPLLRARILRLGPEDNVALFILHHAIADGWSVGVFVNELSYLYNAFAAGRPNPLPPLAVQYPDFAVWQRERLDDDVFGRQLSYWRERLSGFVPLELRADRPRIPFRGQSGARHPLIFTSSLTRSLHALSRQHGTTLFMTLLAAFDAVLADHTGKTDIAVGVPVANRQREEAEGLIGLFTNTLIMRTDLSGDPPFTELLRRVRDTTREAYAHPDLPFEILADELVPQLQPSPTPFFRLMFAMQNAPLEPPELTGLGVEPFEFSRTASKFEMVLSLSEAQAGLAGYMEYQQALFERRTIDCLADRITAVLAELVADPTRRLSELSSTPYGRHKIP